MTIKLSHIVSGVVMIAALIQLVPVGAAFQPALLRTLYGVSPSDSSLVLLLRHRAVLLGLVGALLIAAVRWRSLLAPALAVGLTSKLSFLLLFVSMEANPAIARVASADALSATMLVVVVALLQVCARGRLA